MKIDLCAIAMENMRKNHHSADQSLENSVIVRLNSLIQHFRFQ